MRIAYRMNGKLDVLALLAQNIDHFSDRVLSLRNAQSVARRDYDILRLLDQVDRLIHIDLGMRARNLPAQSSCTSYN